jgi:hypothetical protein
VGIRPDSQSHHDSGDLNAPSWRQRRGDEIEHRSERQDRVPERREIMVQEQLAAHEVKREIMKRPSHHEESDHLIIFYHSGMMEIFISAFLPEDEEGAGDEIGCDAGGAHPPCERISDEVDVSVVFDPEVDTPTEGRPVPWMRVVCVAAGQASIGQPHYFLEFPPFTEEARESVVDLFGVGGNCVNG